MESLLQNIKQFSLLKPKPFYLYCVKKFAGRVEQLLEAREEKQARIDAGELPDFLPETQDIREGSWKILGIPQDLQDRRVEITGPTDRKMVINALNANVKVFMADFEDSMSPAWSKVLDGQINLRDAVNGTISYTNPGNGKHYQLEDDPAVLICRVRGLHLKEKHVSWHGQIIPGALFDFALYFYNNYKALLQKGSGLISTFQNCNRITKRSGGAKCSISRKTTSVWIQARSKRLC